MRTPEQYQQHHGISGNPPISDEEIERITDDHLDKASPSQELVFVSFDDPASARRCVEMYSKHWTCKVDGRGYTVEINVPRVPMGASRRPA